MTGMLLVVALGVSAAPATSVDAPPPVTVAHRVGIELLGYDSINGKYVRYVGLGARLRYHLSESLELDVMASLPGLAWGRYTALTRRLWDDEGLLPSELSLKAMHRFGLLGVGWRPLHGKAVLGRRLVGVRPIVRLSPGVVETRASCELGSAGCTGETAIDRGFRTPSDVATRWRPALGLDAGLEVVTGAWGLVVEISDLVYVDRLASAAGTATGLRQLVFVRFGLVRRLGGD